MVLAVGSNAAQKVNWKYWIPDIVHTHNVVPTRVILSDADHARHYVLKFLAFHVQKLSESVKADPGIPVCDNPNILRYTLQQTDSWEHCLIVPEARCTYVLGYTTLQPQLPLGFSFENWLSFEGLVAAGSDLQRPLDYFFRCEEFEQVLICRDLFQFFAFIRVDAEEQLLLGFPVRG